MKSVILTLLLSFFFLASYSQQPKNDETKIKEIIISFLKYYKSSQYIDNKTIKPSYSLIKDLPVNKKLKKQAIDKAGVEKYLAFHGKSGFLSDEYLSRLRNYFYVINKNLTKNPPISRNEIVKIDGLDVDIQLQTFEPEIILDNLDKATITKSLIVYNKALVSVNFLQEVNLIFVLTKYDDKWLIDYLGHDNTSSESFFRQ